MTGGFHRISRYTGLIVSLFRGCPRQSARRRPGITDAERLARNEKPPVPAELPVGMDPARAAAFVDFCHTLLNSNEFLYVN